MAIAPPLPLNEAQRLKALHDIEILDSDPESTFDELTALAAQICDVPIALVSLVDDTRQWFKSHHGLDARETPRDIAFCAHAIAAPDEILHIQDAQKDARFSANPLVVDEPKIRFYAGAPLVTRDGYALGTLCVIDRTARQLTDAQMAALETLARQVTTQLEMRRMLINLRKSNEDLSQIVYIASHDLQEPLRTISSYLHLLQKRYGEQLDDQARCYIESAVNGSGRLRTLIQEILTFGQISTAPRESEPVDTRAVIDNVTTECAKRIEEAHARIEIGEMPTVRANSAHLAMLFRNLICNAIVYCDKPEPLVKIGARDVDGEWEFTVEDNGIGIDPKYHDRIFQLFQRLHSRSEYPGSGVGLATCARIVDRAGGRMWVDSAVGEGAKFHFTLPL